MQNNCQNTNWPVFKHFNSEKEEPKSHKKTKQTCVSHAFRLNSNLSKIIYLCFCFTVSNDNTNEKSIVSDFFVQNIIH